MVGCAGWSSFRPSIIFGDWRKRFSSVLEAYSNIFNFVEVNSTFYRLPRIDTVKRWRMSVGSDFLFSVKAPKEITHVKRFRDVDPEPLIEVATALKAFFILFQTPASYKYSTEEEKIIKDFLSTLPDYFVYGFELRGWKKEERERIGVVDVTDPFKEEPLPGELTYIRLHGSPPGERMYRYKYTDKDLLWLKKFVDERGTVYVVFNNIWMCEDAIRFVKMLSSTE